MPDILTTGLTASEVHELKNFGSRMTALGVNFAVCDSEGRPMLMCKGGKFETDLARLPKSPVTASDILKKKKNPTTIFSGQQVYIFCPCSSGGRKKTNRLCGCY